MPFAMSDVPGEIEFPAENVSVTTRTDGIVVVDGTVMIAGSGVA